MLQESTSRPEEFPVWLARTTPLAERTIKNYTDCLKLIEKTVGENPTIEGINAFLRSHPRRIYRGTARYYILYKGGDLEKLDRVKEKEPKPHEVPTYEELIQVIKELPSEEHYIALFLLATGCRCHEAFKVYRKEIDTERGIVVLKTKGDKYRAVMIPPTILKELLEYIDNVKGTAELELIFYPHSKATLKSKTMKFIQILNDTSREAINKGMGSHDFRRFYAGFLYNNMGKDIVLMKKILGHTAIETTLKYVEHSVGREKIEEAAEKLEQLSKNS